MKITYEQLNKTIEFAVRAGWEVEPIPRKAEFEVARLIHPEDGLRAIFYQRANGDITAYSTTMPLVRKAMK